MSIHNRETNKNGRSLGGYHLYIYIYIYPISPSTSFIIVVVTTTIPESSTSRQQPPIPDQSRACFSDSTPTGSYFRFRRFRVFAVFAWPAPASPGAETHVSYAQYVYTLLSGGRADCGARSIPEEGRRRSPVSAYGQISPTGDGG